MLEPILCGPLPWAPLIPKLRGHFAEFLNNASPAGLRILSSSTCVGLRYGPVWHDSGFSRQLLHRLRYFSSLRFTLFLPTGAFPPVRLPCLHRVLHSRLRLPLCVPTFLTIRGAGISTCCPSDTRLRLSLGPDFPRADQLYPGNLGYSAWRIPTSISLLIPAFSLLSGPPPLSARLRP